jgi:hypothetical protein
MKKNIKNKKKNEWKNLTLMECFILALNEKNKKEKKKKRHC